MTAKLLRYNFREGVPDKGVASPFFVLKYKKTETGKIRVAVIVSKKIDKRATVRNLLKRRVIHILRELLMISSSGVDVVVYTRKPVSSCSFEELHRAFQQMIKKEGII